MKHLISYSNENLPILSTLLRIFDGEVIKVIEAIDHITPLLSDSDWMEYFMVHGSRVVTVIAETVNSVV